MPRESPGEQSASNVTMRRLSDGWDYQPEWRCAVIQGYLGEIAQVPDRKKALEAMLYREKDPFIRQGLAFRMTGTCVSAPQFTWAFRCAYENSRSGALSMLKAMVIAGLPNTLIAQELGTEPKNVVTTEKLFFDARRYLSNRLWLRSAVVQPRPNEVMSPENSRERLWLSVAYETGWDGLEAVLHGGEDCRDETLETTAQRIEAIAGRRALEFLRGLERDAIAAGEEDLRRFVLARGMRAREAVTSASEQTNKVKEWGLSLVRALSEPNKRSLDQKTLGCVGKPVDAWFWVKRDVNTECEITRETCSDDSASGGVHKSHRRLKTRSRSEAWVDGPHWTWKWSFTASSWS